LNTRNRRVARNNDFSISLYGHALTLSISVASEVRSDFTRPVETRIETSIRLEAGERAFLFSVSTGVTGDKDPSVAMHGDTVAEVVGAEIGSRLAGFVEGRIESPVCIVADDRKIIVVAVDERVPRNYDFSVALDYHALCTVILTANAGCYFASITEAFVEASGRVVPQDRETALAACRAIKFAKKVTKHIRISRGWSFVSASVQPMEMSNLPLLGAPQQTERRFTAWIVE
jgi:hypothetical protein